MKKLAISAIIAKGKRFVYSAIDNGWQRDYLYNPTASPSPTLMQSRASATNEIVQLTETVNQLRDQMPTNSLDRIPRVGDKIDGFTCIDILNVDNSNSDLFGVDKCAVVLVKLDAIESCNYERAKEIAQSLSAELLPIRDVPNILTSLRPFFRQEYLVNMWTEESVDGECKVYYNDGTFFLSKYISVDDIALAIPCRVVIYDKYIKSLFHRSKSSDIELYDIKVDYYLGKVDRIRVDLIRKSDNVSVAFVESVDISDLVLQYKEPFTTNTIEISVKCEYKFIMDGDENGYYAFINEISTNKLTMQDEYMIRVHGI